MSAPTHKQLAANKRRSLRAIQKKLMNMAADWDGVDENEDICGLCGVPGADKIPHPIHWPDERVPDTDLVHADCEADECARASAMCQGRARDEFLRNCG